MSDGEVVEKGRHFPVVGDDDIGAGLDEAIAFPFVDAGAVFLVASDADGNASDAFDFLDFDVAVTEAHESSLVEVIVSDESIDDHFLGEVLVVVLRSVDVGAEEAVEFQGGEFVLDVFFVGTAGEVEGLVFLLEEFQQFAGAGDSEDFGIDSSGLESFDTPVNTLPEEVVVLVFVVESFAGSAAAFGDFLGKLDHLVDGLLAVELHDEFLDLLMEFVTGFFGRGLSEDLDHHGNHDFGPAFANQGEGAVEIEEDGTALSFDDVGIDDLDAGIRKKVGRGVGHLEPGRLRVQGKVSSPPRRRT